jgi:nitrogen regulatory protein PII-like uncharacterized protein
MSKGVVIGSIISGIVGIALGGGGVYLYFTKLYKSTTDVEYLKYKEELDEARSTIKDLQSKIVEKAGIIKSEVLDKSTNAYQEALNEISNIGDSNDDIDEEDGDIRVIGSKDYDDDDEYEKEVIKYYSKDNVLTQDDEVMDMDEFDVICGEKALKTFGPSNEIYIRNEAFMTDYKIVRYNMSYERYINGRK